MSTRRRERRPGRRPHPSPAPSPEARIHEICELGRAVESHACLHSSISAPPSTSQRLLPLRRLAGFRSRCARGTRSSQPKKRALARAAGNPAGCPSGACSKTRVSSRSPFRHADGVAERWSARRPLADELAPVLPSTALRCRPLALRFPARSARSGASPMACREVDDLAALTADPRTSRCSSRRSSAAETGVLADRRGVDAARQPARRSAGRSRRELGHGRLARDACSRSCACTTSIPQMGPERAPLRAA
jgi:hypothetical protein